jgi:hypothetical protein
VSRRAVIWSAPLGALLVALALAPAALASSLPRGFFGVVPQAPPSTEDFARMHGVVGTVRVPIEWFGVEPKPGVYDFGGLDETVGRAADAGIRVLPFVNGSPAWLTGDPARPPLATTRARRAWSHLLDLLVRRYGPQGSFWRGRAAAMPIRRWQIWNEPNYLLFWRPRPEPVRYAQLLRISARTIRRADPGATILTAGVAPVEAGITPWSFLHRLYEVPGVRRDFDVVALHPYAPYVAWVKTQIRFVREVMVEAGDGGTPLQLTELGVASAGAFPNPYDKGSQGQAAFLRRALRMTLRNRGPWHLVGVDWFTWQDSTTADPHCVFCQYGGLLDSRGRPKPAWTAFRALTRAAQLPSTSGLKGTVWGD